MAFDYSIRGGQERERERIVESNGREFARQNVPGTPQGNEMAKNFIEKRESIIKQYNINPESATAKRILDWNTDINLANSLAKGYKHLTNPLD